MLGEDDRVRVHFTVHRAGGLPERLAPRRSSARSSRSRAPGTTALASELVARHGDERGRVLAARWAPRLPDSYKARRSTRRRRCDDIARFERLDDGRRGLRRRPAQRARRARRRIALSLYKMGDKVELSQAMPMLEHLGLRVIEEVPTRLLGGDGDTWVQDFGVLGPDDRPLDLEEVRRARGRHASPPCGAARRSPTR